MEKRILKTTILATILLSLAIMSFSQTTPPRVRRRNTKPTSAYDTTQTATNAPVSAYDTTKKNIPPQSAYGNPTGGTNPTVTGSVGATTNIPIRDAPAGSSGNGLLDSTKPSLRNDAAIELNLIKDRTPLEYENIREDDAVYRVRVWREIDIREKINLPFRYAAEEDNGSQRFIAILLGAIKSGQVTAFSGEDDRFTTPITFDDAMKAFGGGTTVSNHFDSLGNIDYKVKRARNIDPDSIYKFRLKEEWIFDKETSRMYVRILGVAPVIFTKTTDGAVVPNSEHTVWWVYYPDVRPVLSKYDVYNPKNFGARMTWEDLFEARMFSSYIIKSTLDNPYDQSIAQKYPNSTLFRLLEGEKVKDKIFDYEQSLWSY